VEKKISSWGSPYRVEIEFFFFMYGLFLNEANEGYFLSGSFYCVYYPRDLPGFYFFSAIGVLLQNSQTVDLINRVHGYNMNVIPSLPNVFCNPNRREPCVLSQKSLIRRYSNNSGGNGRRVY
jgi:hypothetical protein